LNAALRLIRSATVVRFRNWFVTLVALSALLGTLLHGQVSDEEKGKRAAPLAAQEETQSESSGEESPTPVPKAKAVKAKAKPKPDKSPSPTPKKSSSPKPKARKKHKPAQEEDTPKPKAKPSASADEESAASAKSGEATPTPKLSAKKKKSSPEEEPSPRKKGAKKSKASPGKEEEKPPKAVKAMSPLPSETPVPRPTAPLPRAVAVPTPAAVPAPAGTMAADNPADESAQLTIEKTGYEKRPGFWSRVFGGGGGRSSSGSGYRYLTRSVRDAIDRAPADRRTPRWQFIVVHNSGTRQGNARAFDYYHRHVRHMQNGLAYHFVIGNGTSSGNGQIEIGDRWRRQINGGHVHSDYLNNIALGICLVGDFNRDQPTPAQLQCCEELIRYLRQRCGKVDNHFPIVKPHREVNPPRWATDCPGDAFPYSWFKRF
jgi:N-acetylmuramoyl-L-alanine amidase